MGQGRRFLLIAAAVILIFLLFRIVDQNQESAPISRSYSEGQALTSQDKDGLGQTPPLGGAERRPHRFPPNRNVKRTGEWTDAPTHLEVLVVDEETQAPLPEASVQVMQVWSRSKELSGQTGSDGRAYFELDRGQYWVWANHPAYVPDNVGFAAEGSESRCTVLLTPRSPPGLLVTGSVRDSAGRGVPGAHVSLDIPRRRRNVRPSDPTESSTAPVQIRNRYLRRMGIPNHAETDEDGSFSLEIPEGAYRLSVHSIFHEPFEDDVQVPTSAPLEIVVTELDELVRLSGRVSDGDGHSLSGANVDLAVKDKSGRMGFADSTTGVDGFFEFILPPGAVTLDVKIKGHKTYWQTHEVTQDTEIFPVLEKFKKYRRFTVRVYDGKGQAVANPFVIGTALESGKGVVSPVTRKIDRSEPTQTYQASEYPFRIYATALHVGLGITEAKVIRSYQANIDLRVKGGGRIEGNVADTDGDPVRDFTIVLRKDGFDLGIFRSFSQEGRYRLEGIPPGLYSLSFHSRPRMDPRELATVRPKLVMIQNDRTSFLDVVLRPQGWVKTAGQRRGQSDSDPELRTEN